MTSNLRRLIVLTGLTQPLIAHIAQTLAEPPRIPSRHGRHLPDTLRAVAYVHNLRIVPPQ